MHCYTCSDKRAELTTNEWKDVIDQGYELGFFILTLTGGEILTRNDFFQIAEHAKNRFVLILKTNGTLIDEEIADKIAGLSPKAVHISLHGSKAEIHDRITGVKGSFEKTVKAQQLLVKRNIRIRSCCSVMKENVKDLQNIKKLVEKNGAFLSYSIKICPRMDGTTDNIEHMMDYDDYLLFYRNMLKGWDLEKLEEKLKKDKENNKQKLIDKKNIGFCGGGKNSCCISPVGDVAPCILLKDKENNIRDKSLKEIWETSKLINLLRDSRLSDIPECFNCEYASECSICPASLLLDKGEIEKRSDLNCNPIKTKVKAYTKVLDEMGIKLL